MHLVTRPARVSAANSAAAPLLGVSVVDILNVNGLNKCIQEESFEEVFEVEYSAKQSFTTNTHPTRSRSFSSTLGHCFSRWKAW